MLLNNCVSFVMMYDRCGKVTQNEPNRRIIICIPCPSPLDDAQKKGSFSRRQNTFHSHLSLYPRLKLINIARALRSMKWRLEESFSKTIYIHVRHGNILNYFYCFARGVFFFSIFSFSKSSLRLSFCMAFNFQAFVKVVEAKPPERFANAQ